MEAIHQIPAVHMATITRKQMKARLYGRVASHVKSYSDFTKRQIVDSANVGKGILV